MSRSNVPLAVDFYHHLELVIVAELGRFLFASQHLQIAPPSHHQSNGVDKNQQQDQSLRVEGYHSPVVWLGEGVVAYLYLFAHAVMFVEHQQLSSALVIIVRLFVADCPTESSL